MSKVFNMGGAIRVILIGGTSHAGKSTLARRLADRLGWSALSTDSLARHPGRPWRPNLEPPPPHVAEHYGALDPEALIASVLTHYEGMWPIVRERIEARLADPDAGGLVLEGSALLPHLVATLGDPHIAALWLTAEAPLLAERMRRESDYDDRAPEGRALIDAFLERTERYDRLTIEAVRRLGLPVLVVTAGDAPDDVAGRALAVLGL
jgi:2-phosphoglycerate kinase